jgi:cytoskeletal protein CcmA (bactofilin family)
MKRPYAHIVSLGFGLLLFFICLPAVSAETSFSVSKNYIFPKTASTTGDLYAFGGNVTVAGNVFGDLVAGGLNAFLGGDGISKNAFIIADSVHALSDVGETMRVFARQVVVANTVGKDLALAAWNAVLLPRSEVEGDLLGAALSIEVSGKVNGETHIVGGHVFLNGEMVGPVNILANSLAIGPEAVLRGPLTYSASQVATIDGGAKIESQNFTLIDTRTRAEQFLPTIWGTLIIIKFVILLLSALVAHGILRNISQKFVVVGITQAPKNLIRGFVLSVAVPVAIFVGTLTFVAIPFSLFAAVVFGIGAALALVYTPIIIGSLAWKGLFRSEPIIVNWKTIFVGVCLATLLDYIPYLGTLVWFGFVFVSFGSISKVLLDKFIEVR